MVGTIHKSYGSAHTLVFRSQCSGTAKGKCELLEGFIACKVPAHFARKFGYEANKIQLLSLRQSLV